MVDPWEVNLTTSPRGENGGNLKYYLALSWGSHRVCGWCWPRRWVAPQWAGADSEPPLLRWPSSVSWLSWPGEVKIPRHLCLFNSLPCSILRETWPHIRYAEPGVEYFNLLFSAAWWPRSKAQKFKWNSVIFFLFWRVIGPKRCLWSGPHLGYLSPSRLSIQRHPPPLRRVLTLAPQ